MNPINQFDVTKPEWPFGNLLNKKKRRENLEKIKSHISGQIEQLKSIAEKNYSSSAQDLEIMECCKKNILLTNQMIKKYNQRNPNKQAIKFLNVNFHLWKTHADHISAGTLPAAILAFFDAIVANLGYRSVYNMALTSKLSYQLIQKEACNAFRVKIVSLENYIKNRQQSLIHPATGNVKFENFDQALNSPQKSIIYLWQDEQYRIFDHAIKQLNSYPRKAELSEKNITRITTDWLSMARGLFDKKLKLLEKCFVYTLFFRLMGVRGLKATDPEIQKCIKDLWNAGHQFHPQDIQNLLYEPEKVNYFFLSKKFVTRSLMIRVERHPEAYF